MKKPNMKLNLNKILLYIPIVLAALAILLPTATRNPLLAADFDVHVTRLYTVSPTGTTIHITETRVKKNNSTGYFIPASSTETFTLQNFKQETSDEEMEIKKNSINVTNGAGGSIAYDTEELEDTLEVKVPYPSSIIPGASLTFQLEYDTNELLEKVGSVTNIYIPGLEDTYQETQYNETYGTSTRIIYETILDVPKTLEDATFTLPAPTQTTKTQTGTRYTFSTESILGKTVWHQIGTEQTYHFKITQPIPQTDTTTPNELSFLSKSQYTLTLPRDYAETNQKVYFSSITPQPDSIRVDSNGNVLATFYVDATAESTIYLEGYITLSLTKNGATTDSTSTVDDIDALGEMSEYLQPAEYWESDHPDIINKAVELAEGKLTIMDILHADYEFIIDSIDYDDFKFGERNTRKGAVATLNGGSSVCMEYSDLLIALARAQGIPARAAYGYGYDPKFEPADQEEHQWVQAWLPGYGWLTMDPTWGETGREFIGRDLDHALWYVASSHPNEPSPLEVFTAEEDINLENSSIEVVAVEAIPADALSQTADDLIQEIGSETTSFEQISHVIQTSILGRVLVILCPICTIVLIGTILLNSLVKFLSRSLKKRPVG